jgi:hypothetical protein
MNDYIDCRINVQYGNVGRPHEEQQDEEIRSRQGTASATTEHGSFLAALMRGVRRPDMLQRVVCTVIIRRRARSRVSIVGQ